MRRASPATKLFPHGRHRATDGAITGNTMNRRTIRIVNRLLSAVFGFFGLDINSRRRARRIATR